MNNGWPGLRSDVAWNRSSTLLLAALVGLVAFSVWADRGASRNAPPLEPAVVATIDLERVFRNLQAREAADVKLKELAESLDTEGQQRRDEITVLQQDLEIYAPGSPQYQETTQDVAKKTYELQAWIDYAGRKLDAEKSRTLHDIYKKIKDGVETMAVEGGYDLVIVDDSVVELPNEGSEAETMRQISARRLLYTNRQHIDITDALIQQMNGQFAQGG